MTRRAGRRAVATAVTGLTIAALSACGTGGGQASVGGSRAAARQQPSAQDNGEAAKQGPQVLKDAASALEAAGAVRMKGSATTSMQPADSQSVDIYAEQDSAMVTVTFAGDGRMEMRFVGGRGYVRMSGQPAASMVQLDRKYVNVWLKVPAQSITSADTGAPNLPGLAKSFVQPTPGATVDRAVQTKTVNGRRVVVVHRSDGMNVYVAATGRPYPLQITQDAPASDSAQSFFPPGFSATFYGFGQRTAVTAPVGAIDAPDLPSGSWPFDFSTDAGSGDSPLPTPSPVPLGDPTDPAGLAVCRQAQPKLAPGLRTADFATSVTAAEAAGLAEAFGDRAVAQLWRRQPAATRVYQCAYIKEPAVAPCPGGQLLGTPKLFLVDAEGHSSELKPPSPIAIETCAPTDPASSPHG